MHRIKLLFLLVVSLCFILVLTSWAADDFKRWNSPRDYEPILLKGNNFSDFLSESIFHIFAYAYNLTEDKWIQIPLQIDERDDSTHVWIPSPNNLLDNNDEVVFMARDMGDKAPAPHIWIDDAESKTNPRYEIAAFDPIDPGNEAYIYFYLSSTLLDTVSLSYMNYTEAPQGTGSDIIAGVTYVEGHNTKGIPDYWEIPVSAGGSGVDLLDRQKARVTSAILGFPLEMTEENLTNPAVDYIEGKVRVARRIGFVAELFGLPLAQVDIPMYYYPYSIDSKGATGTLDPDYKVDHIRQSFDMNSNASGMLFHNNFNTDILINGSSENINTNLVFNPEANWYICTGNQGTILTLIRLDPLGTSRLYYYDNSSGGTGDGKEETGDGQSWGDVGIVVTGTSLEGRFSIAYITYFLSQNQLATIGPGYANNFQNPLTIIINKGVIPVELASFDAKISRGDVFLNWTTVSESNNYGFEINRKNKDNLAWDNIGFVEGKGTTNIPSTYSFIDRRLSPDIYYYRLKQIDFDGTFEFSSIKEVTVAAPNTFSLEQNYPNPFNPVTKIDYQIPDILLDNETVNLTIYNLLGSKIRTLISKEQSPGFYTVYWDGKDEKGDIVPTGIYVYRLRAGDHAATKRMVFMK